MAGDAPDYDLARKAWYDRNPASKGDDYSSQIGPHLADRILYTCPANKVAMVEILEARVERVAAAATPGTVWARWRKRIGGVRSRVISAMLLAASNTIKDKEKVSLGTTLMLYPTDELIGDTLDNSTGGTINYHLSYQLTEFEA